MFTNTNIYRNLSPQNFHQLVFLSTMIPPEVYIDIRVTLKYTTQTTSDKSSLKDRWHLNCRSELFLQEAFCNIFDLHLCAPVYTNAKVKTNSVFMATVRKKIGRVWIKFAFTIFLRCQNYKNNTFFSILAQQYSSSTNQVQNTLFPSF